MELQCGITKEARELQNSTHPPHVIVVLSKEVQHPDARLRGFGRRLRNRRCALGPLDGREAPGGRQAGVVPLKQLLYCLCLGRVPVRSEEEEGIKGLTVVLSKGHSYKPHTMCCLRGVSLVGRLVPLLTHLYSGRTSTNRLGMPLRRYLLT